MRLPEKLLHEDRLLQASLARQAAFSPQVARIDANRVGIGMPGTSLTSMAADIQRPNCRGTLGIAAQLPDFLHQFRAVIAIVFDAMAVRAEQFPVFGRVFDD